MQRENLELKQEQLQMDMMDETKQIIEVYQLENLYYIKESVAISLGLTQNPINFGGKIYYIINYEMINNLINMGYEIKYQKIEITKEILRMLEEYKLREVLENIKKNNNYNNNYENFEDDYIEETNRNKTR